MRVLICCMSHRGVDVAPMMPMGPCASWSHCGWRSLAEVTKCVRGFMFLQMSKRTLELELFAPPTKITIWCFRAKVSIFSARDAICRHIV